MEKPLASCKIAQRQRDVDVGIWKFSSTRGSEVRGIWDDTCHLLQSQEQNLIRDLESSLSRVSTGEHVFTVWMDRCGLCEETDVAIHKAPENTTSHLPASSFALTTRKQIQTL